MKRLSKHLRARLAISTPYITTDWQQKHRASAELSQVDHTARQFFWRGWQLTSPGIHLCTLWRRKGKNNYPAESVSVDTLHKPLVTLDFCLTSHTKIHPLLYDKNGNSYAIKL